MLGFYPIAGAPLADFGIRTLTLSASSTLVADRSRSINMVRDAVEATAAIVLRVLPQGVVAIASLLASAGLFKAYVIQVSASTGISATASKLVSLTLSASAALAGGVSRLISMVRAVSAATSSVLFTASLKTIAATVTLSAVFNKASLKVITAGSAISASAGKLFSKTLSASAITGATRTLRNITSALTRMVSAVLESRTATKAAEDRKVQP